MQTKVIINTFSNPFDLKEKTTEYVDPGSLFIDYLKVKYPKGFKRPTRVVLNGSELKPVNFDVILSENDVIEVQIIPQDPVTTAIVIGTIAAAAAAYYVVTNLPEIPSLETPDNLSALKKSGGNAYNLREQSNLSRLGEPIPTQYGKLKWFPDLAAAPYIRYENNVPVTRYLFSLGKGRHTLNDILIGNSSVFDVSNVTYTKYNPGQSMTLFNDNVYTVKDIKNVSFKSPSRSKRELNNVVFDKTAKTITFPSNVYLKQVFSVGDSIRIFCYSDSAVNGVFTVDSVTDTVVTITDSSAWTKSSVTAYAAVYLADEAIINPFYSYTANEIAFPEYLVEGTYSGVFTFENTYLEDITLEFDFEASVGLGSFDVDGVNIESAHDLITGVIVPIDSNGNEVSEHYRIYNTNQEFFSSIGGNAYQIIASLRDWKNNTDLSELTFPTATNLELIFYENSVAIPSSDISSIDYTNGIVTFNTAKSGTIGVENIVLYKNFLHDIFNMSGGGYTFNLVDVINKTEYRTTFTRNLFINTLLGFEYNVWSKYKCFITCGRGAQGGYAELKDNVVLSRVKVRYSDVQEYPAISLLAVEIINSPMQMYEEKNNISVVTERNLIQWNGTSWSTPTATRSIAWALADIWMSTYGASRSYLNLDLDTLMTLDTLWTSRGDTFDGVFDASITVWEALQKVARCGRSRPIFDGATLTFVRDGAQSTYSAVFGPNNILPDSFKLNYNLPDNQTPSVVRVKYLDEDNNYSNAEVLSSSNGGKEKVIDFFGCVNYNQAWKESQYLEAQMLQQRLGISFSTEMVGHIPFYGDLISVQYDLPSWGQGGQVAAKAGTTITTSQPLDWSGSAPFYMSFMRPNGSLSGPHTVTQGSGNYEAILSTDVTDFTFISTASIQNPTVYQFGPSSNWNKSCVVTKVTPQTNNEKVAIECVPYIAAVHTADVGTPPTKPSVTPTGNAIPPDIGGLTLSNIPGSGSVIAVWNPLSDIGNYKVQKSTDNITWVDVSTPSAATETIAATGVLYVRVASVVDSIIGNYTISVIVAS
jgi:hypothetical protein